MPLPDYMRPFDSVHPLPAYREQLEATAALRTVVEDKVLATIHGLTPASNNAGVYSSLQLESFDFNVDPVEIEIECADTTTHPDLPPYIVRFFEGPRRLDGSFMQVHDYTIPNTHSDEGTTRRDIALAEPKKFDIQTLKPIPRDRPLVIDPKLFEALAKILESGSETQRFEKEAGLNDQPIGVREARAIALIISRGQLKVSTPRNSK